MKIYEKPAMEIVVLGNSDAPETEIGTESSIFG